MGLAVTVGVLSDLLENDPEGAEWMEEDLAAANALLAANNLPTHVEPRDPLPEASRCPHNSFSSSSLHYLRRVYAHVTKEPTWRASELAEGEDPTKDPVLGEVTNEMQSHLVCHCDAEGFYLPIDFTEVLIDDEGELPGGMLGSTQRLMAELATLAPVLKIELKDGELSNAEAKRLNREAEKRASFWTEKLVWLSLFEAARLSLKYKSAICFG